MKEDIINFINNIAGPETSGIYLRAFKLFDLMNLEDYILPFDEISTMSEELDSISLIDKCNTLLDEFITDLLKQHGIFIFDETKIHEALMILELIPIIVQYEDFNSLLNITDTDISDEEKLASILSIVGSNEIEFYITLIERVNPGLIRKISELLNNKKSDIVEYSNTNEQVVLINKLFNNVNNSIIYPKLKDGLKFNMLFDLYIKLYWEDIVSTEDYILISRDLVAICIISNDKKSRVLETIKDFIGINLSDLNLINKVLDTAYKFHLDVVQDNGIKNES